ncbi:hypothetical protein WA158_004320 [Blastocystis sp. Blastoise]
MSTDNAYFFIKDYNTVVYTHIVNCMLNPKDVAMITDAEYDGVTYFILRSKPQDSLYVSVKVNCWETIANWGIMDVLNSMFPGQICSQPIQGYNVSILAECKDSSQIESYAMKLARLRIVILSCPFNYLFDSFCANSITTLPIYEFPINSPEIMYMYGSSKNIMITYSIHINDSNNIGIASIFLQEFSETQRTAPSAPSCTFSKTVPEDLKSCTFSVQPNVGFITFCLNKEHMIPKNREKTIQGLISFRSYLSYHLTATKTYLHSVMRNRTDIWKKALSDAKIE